MKTVMIVVTIFFLFFAKNVNSAVRDTVVILFNSDSYGMIQPCRNCPSAGGGIAPKIYLRDSLNIRYQGRFINLQGGGFTAGGEFDRYRQVHRELDSLKTVYKLRSFPAMGYDAVGVGHEDYKYRGLFEKKQQKFNIPAVSLNVLNRDSTHLFEPYVIIERLGRRIAVTSITGRSDYIERDHIYIPPFELLEGFISRIKDEVDGIIILNYCGDDSLQKVTDAIHSAGAANETVVLNSYIKRFEAREYLYQFNSITVVNFNFHSRIALILTGDFLDNNFTISRISFYGMGYRAPASPKGIMLIEEYERERRLFLLGEQKVNIDMFISRTCPFCKMALEQLRPLFKEENVKITLFETDYGNEGEYKISPFLAGQFLDRDRFLERAVSMESLYPPDVNIDSLISLIDPQVLKQYYERRKHLTGSYDIFAVPDIFINDTRLESKYLPNLLGYVCRNFKYSNIQHCKKMPDCLTAFDCPNVPGMSVKCTQEGKCVYSSAIPRMFVVYDPKALFPYDEEIINQTRQKVASLEVEFISFEHLDRQSEKLKPYTGMLPLYFVNENAYNSQGLQNVKQFFDQAGIYYKLTEKLTVPNVVNSRELVDGDMRVFVSLFHTLSRSREILDTIVEKYAANEVSLGFILRKDGEGNLKTLGPQRELEQIERIRAVEILYPQKKGDYLRNWLKDPFSDNWKRPLRESGINPSRIYRAIKNGKIDLKFSEDFKVFESVPPKSYVVLLVNNRELLGVSTPEFIGEIKGKLSK